MKKPFSQVISVLLALTLVFASASVASAGDEETTPTQIIASLARETGWDLTLAVPIVSGPTENSLSVAFAEESAIYAAIPDKEAIYTVLDRTAQTLKEKLSLDAVYFTSPDGGDLDFEGRGCPFFLSVLFPWSQEAVRETNEPLPDDEIGLLFVGTGDAVMAGVGNIDILFERESVSAGTGKITIHDGAGNIFFQADVSDSERVEFMAPVKEVLAYNNLKSGTQVRIWLGKMTQPGEHYSVHIDAGAFTAGNIKTKEFTLGEWEFDTFDFGIIKTNTPGNSTPKLGTDLVEEITLGESARRVEATYYDSDGNLLHSTELSQDGTLSYHPLKAGNCYLYLTFYLKDETTYEVYYTFPVEE